MSTSEVSSEYARARAKLIAEVGSARGATVSVARRFNVNTTFVSQARRAVNVWGADRIVNELYDLGLARLYAGAKLAQKIGRKKAEELMLSKDSATLSALASNRSERKKLPTLDSGVYEQITELWRRFDERYAFLNDGQTMSFDRFMETVVAVFNEFDDNGIDSIIRALWGDVYD